MGGGGRHKARREMGIRAVCALEYYSLVHRVFADQVRLGA